MAVGSYERTAMISVDRSLASAIWRLCAHFGLRQRVKFIFILGCMLAGAVAEFATIGAILPFLSLIANPDWAATQPMLRAAFAALGSQTPQQSLVYATLLFAATALAAGFVRLAVSWFTQKFVLGLGCELDLEIYRHTLLQPYSYHIRHNTSDLVAGIDKASIVVFYVLLPLLQGFSSALICLFILGALIAINPAVAIFAGGGFGLLYLIIVYATRGRLRGNSEVIANNLSRRVQAVQEGLGGIRDVLIDRTHDVYLDKFKAVDAWVSNAQAVRGFIGSAPRSIIESIGMVLIALVAFYLARDDSGLATAVPTLGALALGAQRLLPTFQLIFLSWANIEGSRQVLFDVLSILDLPIDPGRIAPSNQSVIPFRSEIQLEGVSFRYAEAAPDVLINLSLTVKKGERVGFVGKTGCGKSTLLDLIMGLLEPTGGTIRIDGAPLNRDTVASWQSQIAHVPQAIYLADSTIAENIAFGVVRGLIDETRVREAARKAEIADFIESQPDGYGAMVGERGVRLSGGQRQRIGIARALYKSAKVLIFDEATSALDNETEAAVIKSIEALGSDLTILMIAHRLSTVEICDRVIKLEGGRALEMPGHFDAAQESAPVVLAKAES